MFQESSKFEINSVNPLEFCQLIRKEQAVTKLQVNISEVPYFYLWLPTI